MCYRSVLGSNEAEKKCCWENWALKQFFIPTSEGEKAKEKTRPYKVKVKGLLRIKKKEEIVVLNGNRDRGIKYILGI